MKRVLTSIFTAASVMMATASAGAQAANKPDLQHQPTLYVVPYAHLDTQWNWNMQQSISEYLLKTLRVNFYYMDKYPHYIFNWTGSNRYRLMKEYYPADYEKMKLYVARGQWYPSGSSVEENDVNLPQAEAILRQVLYGNEYFRKEFGKPSADYMLPDCFGFPASLPEILAHAGILGFSTQKLNAGWQPAPLVGGPDSIEKTPEGIPFNVGVWEGPDGETVLAAVNPGSYAEGLGADISKASAAGAKVYARGPKEQNWVSRVELDGKVTGIYADFHYVGVGDIGGAPSEETVRLLEAIVTHGMATVPDGTGPRPYGPQDAPPGTPVQMGDGPLHVIEAGSDQLFKDIPRDEQSKFPRYKGDLELINHSAGSLTSEAMHKRWNRKNEILAGEAEEASVAAMWMGGRTYPQQRMNDAWNLVLAGQFHDTGAGTASPRSYEFAQNDDVIALNQFAGVLTSATQAVTSAMNTSGAGVPVVVYNSLNVARQDVVSAEVHFDGAQPKAVSVTGPDGKVVPSQVEDGKVLFLANAPSVGYAVYHVGTAATSDAATTELKVTPNSLENAHYRVTLNAQGDVSSIFDKKLNKELLSAPVRLAIMTDTPVQWPAWNMDFDQEQAEPQAYVSGPATIHIVENGPVRVGIEVTRETAGSKFAQTVRLSAGDAGDRVEFADTVDWHTKQSNLKAVFNLAASNKNATYSWDVGTVERPNAAPRQFEVGSHHWIDLTDNSGAFGATILTDVKNASDKRDDHTLRLTLLRTPGFRNDGKKHDHSEQLSQDWGTHQILFGIAGHADGWRESGSYWQAYRLSTPMETFVAAPHDGALGQTFSIVSISDPHVKLMALKKAEDSDDVVIRMVEMNGQPLKDVHVKFPSPVVEAHEAMGQEDLRGRAKVNAGELTTAFKPYEIRTFVLKLAAAPASIAPVPSAPVKLAYNVVVSSNDDTKTVGGFNAKGDALPAEMLPTTLAFDGVNFQLGPAGTGIPDALAANGQKLPLPEGDYNMVYVLAASSDGDREATFRVGDAAQTVRINAWDGFVGQADTRIWKDPPANIRTEWAVSATHATWDLKSEGSDWWKPKYPDDYIGLKAGYIKQGDIAWYASHHHTRDGLNEPYEYSYLFAYALKLPSHSRTLTLPRDEKIRILAISVAKQDPAITPAEPLYDTLGRTEPGPMVAAAPK